MPIWVDSDDERLVISLASNNRLRKLRVTESEDLISGKEYMMRLRRHYERLYPPPAWASGTIRSAKKRRKSNFDDSGDDDSSDEDMDLDSDDPSTQPLLDLLRDSSILNQTPSSGPAKRRKLRPEVVEVGRLKDVGSTHPVRYPFIVPLMALVLITAKQVHNYNLGLPSRLSAPPLRWRALRSLNTHPYLAVIILPSRPDNQPPHPTYSSN